MQRNLKEIKNRFALCNLIVSSRIVIKNFFNGNALMHILRDKKRSIKALHKTTRLVSALSSYQ